MDDLKGMTIDGKEFRMSDYSFNSQQETSVLTFVEYCYSFDIDRQANYNLYVYVHNPKGREYENSARNAITLRVGASSGNFKKYPLKELSVCKEKNYEGLFYKYSVEITDIQKALMLNELNSAARAYEIGEIELVESGRLLATSYEVGSKYQYSGYSKGYGPNKDGLSTLQVSRVDTETLTLDVKSTYYRPDGTNGKNDYTQDSLHSVYFAVPNDVIEKYGAMTAVHATWLNAVLKPMLVTGNKEACEVIRNYLGVNLSEDIANDLKYAYAVNYHTENYGQGAKSHYADLSYNLPSTINGNQVYTTALNTLYSVFYSGSAANSADDYMVSSSDISAKLKSSKADYGGELVNEKYAACMFESVDEKPTDINIQANKTYSLTDEAISDSWWERLLGIGSSSKTFDGIKAIYAVKESDMTGTTEEVSDRLYIAEHDYNAFKSYYEANKADNTVYLFRYQVSDYISQEASLYEVTYNWLTDYTLWEKDTNAYFFQETVNLDFDIIDVTFTADEVSTVLPVLMSPMDIIHDGTPPVHTQSDSTIPWWVWLIVGLLALFIIGKLVPPIFKGVIIILVVVTVPVWGPIWLIVKIIKKIRGDYD